MKATTYTTALILIITNTVFGQVPGWAWAKSAGGSDNENAQKVATDAQGNIFIVGAFNSATITIGSDVLTNTASSEPFVAKYDPAGNPLWARCGAGGGNATAYAVAVDARGNVYMAGGFNGASLAFAGHTLNQAGGSDGYVVKYDSQGNFIWFNKWGGSGYDDVDAMTIDGNQNVIIGGTHQNDDITFGSTTLTKVNDNDIFLAKLDSSGTAIWARSVAGSSWDNCSGVGVDAGNNVYICGVSGSSSVNFGSLALSNAGSANIIMGKFDPSGTPQWAKNPGGAAPAGPHGFRSDAAGNLYLTGYCTGAMNFDGHTISNNGGADMMVVKFDGTGTALWAASAGGPGSDDAADIATDASGNVYVTGYFGSDAITFGSTTLNNTSGVAGPANSYIVKYDKDGNNQWALNPVSTIDNEGYGITTDPGGNVVVAGGFYLHDITFGSYTLTTNGTWDIYVAKLGGCTIAKPDITASRSTSLCQGDSVTLTSSPAASYLWSNNANSRSITVKTAAAYTVVVSAGVGCSATSSPIVVTVDPAATAGQVSVVPNTICSGDSSTISISGSIGNTLQWQSSTSTTGFTNINGATDLIYGNTFTQSAYFRAYVSNGGCSDTSAFQKLTVKPAAVPPTLSTNDTSICASDSTRIDAQGTYGAYNWSNGDTRPYTMAQTAGGYWVTVSDANGCTAVSGHLNIKVNPVPSVSIVLQGDTLSSLNASAYQWYFNDAPITGATFPVYIAHQSGDYSVQVTDSNNCSAISTDQHIDITGIYSIFGEGSLKVYPDPFVQLVFVEGKRIEDIALYDVNGRMVFNERYPTATNRIMVDLSFLQDGVYYIKVKTGDKILSQPVIKQ